MADRALIELDAREMAALDEALRRGAAGVDELLSGIAAAMESGARERIAAGGPAPDGGEWRGTRRGNEPILNMDGGLADSIESGADASGAWWGSNLVYSAIHQFGGTIEPQNAAALAWEGGDGPVFARKVEMPARPYLGWGATEVRLADDVAEAWFWDRWGRA